MALIGEIFVQGRAVNTRIGAPIVLHVQAVGVRNYTFTV